MKAVVYQGIEQVEVLDLPEPEIIGPGDIIVKVERAAICGSDMHVFHGRETGIDKGTIMGHEFVGTVVETGGEVRNFKKGDRVISPFTINCAECFFCKNGFSARCEQSRLFGWVSNGEGLQGVHAEFVRVPLGDSTLVALPESLSWEEGNLLSDIFCTGFFGADMAEIKPQGTYVVIGCGPVGQMAIKAARMLGAEHLYAVDSVPFRLNMAEKNGAIPVNYSSSNPYQVILAQTEGRGADGVIEAVGGFEPMRTAFGLLRNGGILASVGVQAYDRFPFDPPQIYDKNITLKAGRCSVRSYLDRLIPLVLESKPVLDDVITHTFDLKDGKEAYRLFDERKDIAMKVLLKP